MKRGQPDWTTQKELDVTNSAEECAAQVKKTNIGKPDKANAMLWFTVSKQCSALHGTTAWTTSCKECKFCIFEGNCFYINVFVLFDDI